MKVLTTPLAIITDVENSRIHWRQQYSGIHKSAICKTTQAFQRTRNILLTYNSSYNTYKCIVNLIRNFSELPLFILQRVGNK